MPLTFAQIYEGRISGAAIATALQTAQASGADLVVIPYGNGQRVVIIEGTST